MANLILLNKIKPNRPTKIGDHSMTMQLFTSKLKSVIGMLNSNYTYCINSWNLFILGKYEGNEKYYISGIVEKEDKYFKEDFPDIGSVVNTNKSATEIVYSLEERVAELESRVVALKSAGGDIGGAWRPAYVAVKPSYGYASSNDAGSAAYGDMYSDNRCVTVKAKYQGGSRWMVFGGTQYVVVPGLFIKGKARYSIPVGYSALKRGVGKIWSKDVYFTCHYSLCIK